jgi:hypothetical protein
VVGFLCTRGTHRRPLLKTTTNGAAMTELAQAEAQTDRNPSLPQIAAGNYKKGKYRIHGVLAPYAVQHPERDQ